jgi:hypothetical protein
MSVRLILGLATIALAGAGCSPGDDTPGRDVGGDTGPDILPCSVLIDSDGDMIADQYEGMDDADADTVPNHLDDDSDGDTILDAVEGDTGGDYCRYPRNSDTDPLPDFLDLDSDNDGLSDNEEHGRWGTDPLLPDTDGDTVTDLGEVAYGSDPTDRDSGIASDDFFVILPYLDPPKNRDLYFGTNLQVADVYFLMDSTGSMSGSIENVVSSLQSTIVPALRREIPDVQMGVGAFNDYPTGGYGSAGDQPFWHDLNITDDDAQVRNRLQYVLDRDRGYGADTPESYGPALWMTASGRGTYEGGAAVPDQHCSTPPDDPGPRNGYPCFRYGALPIVIIVGDAPWHNGPGGAYSYGGFWAPTFDESVSEMLGIGARMIGVCARCSEGNEAWNHMAEMARLTGTVDAAGDPLVAVSSDGTVSTRIVEMVQTLASFTPQDVTTTKEDDPTDLYGIDATQFMTAITPVTAVPASGAAGGWNETTFFQVQPGTQVVFDVTFENNFFAPRESAAVFKAKIVVLGNGVARLDERIVIIIVPPSGDFVWIG